MPSKSAQRAQAYIRSRHRRNVRRLVKAGLLEPSQTKDKAKIRRTIIKYNDLLSGKATALKTNTKQQAAKLRGKLGLRGTSKTIVVPRHKGEKLKITKDAKIVGTREQYGQTVHREVGKFKFDQTPKPGEKLYYTIPTRKRGAGKLKRHTFSSFDEMLFYLEKYEIDFEDIEDFIEVEHFKVGSKRQKQTQETLNTDRARAAKRLRRARKKNKRDGR
jgi:hypothetical protein